MEREGRKKKIYGYLACVCACVCAKSDKRYHGKLGSWIGKSEMLRRKGDAGCAKLRLFEFSSLD